MTAHPATAPLKRSIAVIPARGGSKRIPRKNIRPFLGVPLLARTVSLLQSTGLFSRIVVSTDDDEIASVSLAAGAEVPFTREHSLANDHAGTAVVIRDAIHRLESAGESSAAYCCVYPAAVLCSAATLVEAHAILAAGDHDFVFPVAAFPYPIQRALRITEGSTVEMIWPEHLMSRSQDLEPAFHDVGQFYLGTRAAWIEERVVFGRRSRAIVIPHGSAQDIDTPDDWQRAETIYRSLQAAA